MKVPDAVFGDDEGYCWEASVVALRKDWAQLHFDEDDKKHWFTLSEARQWRDPNLNPNPNPNLNPKPNPDPYPNP